VRAIASCSERALPGVVLLGAVLALLPGCITEQRGWVSGIDSRERAAVTLDGAFARRGNASATLANGQRCHGSFNTVAERVTYNDERPTIIESEDAQLGILVLECPGAQLIRCEFSRGSAGAGFGKCEDGSGHHYSLALSDTGQPGSGSPNDISNARAER
jgi:hypothetical protein